MNSRNYSNSSTTTSSNGSGTGSNSSKFLSSIKSSNSNSRRLSREPHKSIPPVQLSSIPLAQMYNLSKKYHARVICIGDVHGCIDELVQLLRACSYRPGDVVLLLGDLVAKGPASTQVVQLAMDIGALSVRGNHDHEVIRQGTLNRKKSKFGDFDNTLFTSNSNSNNNRRRARSNEHVRIATDLSDEEFSWLAALPYYIQSPDLGTLFVHAGIAYYIYT